MKHHRRGRMENLCHDDNNGVTFSSTCLRPTDDAPRVADVFTVHNPVDGPRGSFQYLEVAVGHPRAMPVLYPRKGQEILCTQEELAGATALK